MSRRVEHRDYAYVGVEILCESGHRVGIAIKNLMAQLPQETYILKGDIWFEEAPNPSDTSGRIRGVCTEALRDESEHPNTPHATSSVPGSAPTSSPDCGQPILIRWERVKTRLDQNEQTGPAIDRITMQGA